MSGSADERLPALTGLRGLAALAVFLLHAWYLGGKADPAPAWPWLSQALQWIFAIGWSGVDVFFTLSGFLLALPFLRQDCPAPATGPFLWRRWRRIFPAYYAQLAILFALAALSPAFAGHLRAAPTGVDLAVHGALWFYLWPTVAPWNPVWWTLPVEFGFYLCLPWLAGGLKPRRWFWLIGLIVMAWVWRLAWLSWGEPGIVTSYRVEQLPGRIDQFLIGMLAAYVWVRRSDVRQRVRQHRSLLMWGALALLLALPALWLLVNPTPHDVPSAHPALLAWHSLASIAVVGLLWSGAERAGWLGATPLQWLGTISYGVYLWHYPVLMVLRQGMREPGLRNPEFWPFVISALALTLLLAALSYFWIERPCLRRGVG